MEEGPVPAEGVSDWEGHFWHDEEYVDWWIHRIERDDRLRERHQAERAEMVARVRDAFGAEEGLRMLDLGCGWGGLAAALMDSFRHASLVALDGSETMLAQCRQTLRPFADRAAFVVADLDLPLASSLEGPFDVVVSSRALHHLRRDRLDVLYRELVALMSPGGVFLNMDRVLPDRRAQLVDVATVLPAGLAILNRWAPKWLRCAGLRQQQQMLEQAGFSVVADRFVSREPSAAQPWIIQATKARQDAETVESS